MRVRLIATMALLLLGAGCTQPADPPSAQQPGALQPSAQQAGEPQAAQVFLPDGGPPVVNGLYDAHGSCPFEGCGLADLYVTAPVEILDRPALDARVIATIPAGEWVSAGDSIDRHRPARGVVVGEVNNLSTIDGVPQTLELGDIVYTTDFGGEGTMELWRRGDRLWWTSPSPDDDGVTDGIRLVWPTDEQRAADQAAGAGWWVELVRANGERGWTRETGDLDCLSLIDAPPHCEDRAVLSGE